MGHSTLHGTHLFYSKTLAHLSECSRPPQNGCRRLAVEIRPLSVSLSYILNPRMLRDLGPASSPHRMKKDRQAILKPVRGLLCPAPANPLSAQEAGASIHLIKPDVQITKTLFQAYTSRLIYYFPVRVIVARKSSCLIINIPHATVITDKATRCSNISILSSGLPSH